MLVIGARIWVKYGVIIELIILLHTYMYLFCIILCINIIGGFVLLYRGGMISLEDYMSFMISRETENVQSMSEVVNAFRAITANGDRPYVTEQEIRQV